MEYQDIFNRLHGRLYVSGEVALKLKVVIPERLKGSRKFIRLMNKFENCESPSELTTIFESLAKTAQSFFEKSYVFSVICCGQITLEDQTLIPTVSDLYVLADFFEYKYFLLTTIMHINKEYKKIKPGYQNILINEMKEIGTIEEWCDVAQYQPDYLDEKQKAKLQNLAINQITSLLQKEEAKKLAESKSILDDEPFYEEKLVSP